MAEYRLSPQAQRDLDAVFDYTVAHWGVSQAMRYTDRIAAACADLAAAPQQAQGCADIRPGYRRRSVEQHVVYFWPTIRYCSRDERGHGNALANAFAHSSNLHAHNWWLAAVPFGRHI